MPTATPGDGARDFLFVQSTTEIGGAETVLLNLFSASEELRRRSVIANLGFGDGDVPARLRAMGAEVVDLPRARLREPGRLLRMLAALRRLIRERQVKVVVGNGAHPQIVGGAASRIAGARSVFLVNMIHAHPLWKNDVLDAIAVSSPCDLMLANSKASEATLRLLRPKVPKRVLYPGTPPRQIDRVAAAAARAGLGGVAPDNILIGVFGRLQRWKGQDVFVEAAAEVARAHTRARFVVVGGSVFGLEPEFLEGLKRRVGELGLGDRLVFTGFRNDVPALMGTCDIVCHTTRVAEPFGMVIVEAMMLGRAVVATRGGGPSEIIEPGQNGLLVSPEQPGELAAAISQLCADGALRLRLGQDAARRARAEFGSDAMAAGLIRELNGMLSGDRTAG